MPTAQQDQGPGRQAAHAPGAGASGPRADTGDEAGEEHAKDRRPPIHHDRLLYTTESWELNDKRQPQCRQQREHGDRDYGPGKDAAPADQLRPLRGVTQRASSVTACLPFRIREPPSGSPWPPRQPWPGQLVVASRHAHTQPGPPGRPRGRPAIRSAWPRCSRRRQYWPGGLTPTIRPGGYRRPRELFAGGQRLAHRPVQYLGPHHAPGT